MKLSLDLIAEIANVLRESCSAPLPGGHGVWFPEVRSRYPHFTSAAETGVRCYICLALLGDGEGEQRWNPKEWWPHALAWFDIYCPEIANRLDGPRWAYLLAAMLQVVEAWLKTQSEHRHLAAYVTDCHARAEGRLRDMTRGKGKLSSIPTKPVGAKVEGQDERWQMAGGVLGGPNAQRAEMLYFLYILHCKLGVAQHSLDERFSTRISFYSQLREILEQGIGLSELLWEAGARIAQALSETLLVSDAEESSFSTTELAARLPACFQLSHHFSESPPRKLIEMQLAYAPPLRDRLLAAHDLAEAVADLAMNIFYSGMRGDPAFRTGAYYYLHSLIRYGPKMYEEQVKRGTLPAGEIVTPDKSMLAGVPMTRSFAERMRSGLLVEPARERLASDFGEGIYTTNKGGRRLDAAPTDRGSL
jgi:hypothetical protein